MQLETNSNLSFSAEIAAQLLQSQGRHVIRTASCWWYNVYGQKNVYYSFPPNRLVTPSKAELSEVFKQAPRAKAVRYLSPADGAGSDSYMWTCRKPYDLDAIDGKARNQVRQGLKSCEIRRISLEQLEVWGEKANSDSLKRFGIEPRPLRFGKEMRESESYEAWASFVDGSLASYLVTFRVEDWVFVQVHRSDNEYLRYRPNNALIFKVFEEVLSRPDVSTVSYGWEPLLPLGTLDKFKLAMGADKEACKQCIVLAPWLRVTLLPVVCRIVEAICGLGRGNRRFRQIAGAFRVIRQSHVY